MSMCTVDIAYRNRLNAMHKAISCLNHFYKTVIKFKKKNVEKNDDDDDVSPIGCVRKQLYIIVHQTMDACWATVQVEDHK